MRNWVCCEINGKYYYIPFSNIRGVEMGQQYDKVFLVGSLLGEWKIGFCCSPDGKPCHFQRAIITM